jgi:hypothetical protein
LILRSKKLLVFFCRNKVLALASRAGSLLGRRCLSRISGNSHWPLVTGHWLSILLPVVSRLFYCSFPKQQKALRSLLKKKTS